MVVTARCGQPPALQPNDFVTIWQPPSTIPDNFPMKPLLDAFWRAAAYCLHPRVIMLSLLPLIVVGGVAALLGYFYWDAAVAAMRHAMNGWPWLVTVFGWFETAGVGGLGQMVAPLVLVALVVPVIVVLSLLLVALLMTPALVKLVARQRFPRLERLHGASFWQSVATSLGCTLIALIALAISIPLWFIPPLVLIVPPLIWGWLTYRVMGFDVLAEHASVTERQAILRRHRWPMLWMGTVAGYLGAAPSLVWAFGALTVLFAPLLAVVAVWLYTLVFAFSALWFAHYALWALQDLRARRAPRDLGAAGSDPRVPPPPGALPPAQPDLSASPKALRP